VKKSNLFLLGALGAVALLDGCASADGGSADVKLGSLATPEDQITRSETAIDLSGTAAKWVLAKVKTQATTSMGARVKIRGLVSGQSDWRDGEGSGQFQMEIVPSTGNEEPSSRFNAVQASGEYTETFRSNNWEMPVVVALCSSLKMANEKGRRVAKGRFSHPFSGDGSGFYRQTVSAVLFKQDEFFPKNPVRVGEKWPVGKTQTWALLDFCLPRLGRFQDKMAHGLSVKTEMEFVGLSSEGKQVLRLHTTGEDSVDVDGVLMRKTMVLNGELLRNSDTGLIEKMAFKGTLKRKGNSSQRAVVASFANWIGPFELTATIEYDVEKP
jgi:hypothetical protein